MTNATARHIYVLCPDDPAPGGGQQMLYRHVDILNQNGFRASIVHSDPGVRLTWFANETAVTHQGALRVGPDDIVAVPETSGPELADMGDERARKVVINQNCYYTFRFYGEDLADLRSPYTDPRVVATIVVSEDSRRYLQHAFPDARVLRMRYWIDPGLYYPPTQPRKKQIAFMPRRNMHELQQVLRILLYRGALDGWEVVPIDKKSKADAAAMMREASVFLSAGSHEGFGLPPAEAMACGCVTIGYHGFGGAEFFTAEHGFPIGVGDVKEFARTTERVLQQLNRDPGAFAEMTARAQEFIAQTYSLENERADIVGAWSTILSII